MSEQKPYSFLYKDIQHLIESMFHDKGIELVLSSGTDANSQPYATDVDARNVFFDAMEPIINKVEKKSNEVRTSAFHCGRNSKAKDIRVALNIGVEEE